jgi:hypothetical protein
VYGHVLRPPCNIKSQHKSFERVEEFKYLGMTLTNQNSIHEEITSREKSKDAVQNLLSSSLLYKHIRNKMYMAIVLPLVLYGCKT